MVWSFLFTFWQVLPWVAVALLAALAWRKRAQSRSLFLQAMGATAMVLLVLGQWVIVEFIMRGLKVADKYVQGGNYVFGFLIFVALCAFAAGYCAERFARRKPDAADPQRQPAN